MKSTLAARVALTRLGAKAFLFEGSAMAALLAQVLA
jgi:hypothetical protein